MSLWLRKTSELEEYARKRAIWGALVLYFFIVVLIFICFIPQKHTVSLLIPRNGAPAPVMFYSWGKRGVTGLGRARRFAGAHHLVKKRRKMHAKKEKTQRQLKKDKVEKKPSIPQIQPKSSKKKHEKKDLKARSSSVAKKEDLKKTVLFEQLKQKAKEPPIAIKNSIPIKEKTEKIKTEQKVVQRAEKEKEVVESPCLQCPEKKIEQEPVLEQDEEEIEEIEEEVGVFENGTAFDEEGISREGLAVMRSVGRVWHPPRGLSPLLSARLIVSLNNTGSIEKIVIEKKSGVLAFDMAARAALWRAEYPSVFWGKNIAVVFGKADF